MTRLASILGVATVATLVLLSGCEQAVETDHVEDLEGTWSSAELNSMVQIDTNDDQVPDTLVSATATVTLMITAGDKLNTGTFTLTVAQTLGPPTNTVLPPVVASGTIVVDSSDIAVSIADIMSAVPLPDAAEALKTTGPHKLSYEVTDTKLDISSPLLPALLVGTTIMGAPFTDDTKLTFTKQSGPVAGSR